MPSLAKPSPHVKVAPNVKSYDNLIALYNDFYDFATKLPNGRWIGQEWPRNATHKLLCTIANENIGPDFNARRPHKDADKIGGFAEAVAAIPLKRELPTSKLKIARPLPKAISNWPVYKVADALDKKRRVLIHIAQLTGCFRRYAWKIREFTSEQCDWYQKEFIRASRWLRAENARIAKKNGGGFWSKLKAKAETEQPPVQYKQQPKKKWIKIHLTRATSERTLS